MTNNEKLQYALARQGLAKLMGDADEVVKWSSHVSEIREIQQRNAPVTAEQICPNCGSDEVSQISDVAWLCDECGWNGQI